MASAMISNNNKRPAINAPTIPGRAGTTNANPNKKARILQQSTVQPIIQQETEIASGNVNNNSVAHPVGFSPFIDNGKLLGIENAGCPMLSPAQCLRCGGPTEQALCKTGANAGYWYHRCKNTQNVDEEGKSRCAIINTKGYVSGKFSHWDDRFKHLEDHAFVRYMKERFDSFYPLRRTKRFYDLVEYVTSVYESEKKLEEAIN